MFERRSSSKPVVPKSSSVRSNVLSHAPPPLSAAFASDFPLLCPACMPRKPCRLTTGVRPRRIWVGWRAPMCTGRILLMDKEHVPPGAASGGQQRSQRAAASAIMEQPSRTTAQPVATSFFNGRRCGARQTARVGAIQSCALRCASACGGCARILPLCATVCKSDVFVRCARSVTFGVMHRARVFALWAFSCARV